MKDNWAKRKTAKDLRAEGEVAKAREKRLRDVYLKETGGKGVFKQLHAWFEKTTKSYYEEMGKRRFEVGVIQPFGGPESHDFFKVTDAGRDRLPMTISYRSANHEITGECGPSVPRPQYLLSVRDNGDLFFETPKRQSKTIEQLGEELLDFWEGA